MIDIELENGLEYTTYLASVSSKPGLIKGDELIINDKKYYFQYQSWNVSKERLIIIVKDTNV
jgi:hypothetical protein